MLVPLLEDREALEDFDELAAMPGISAIFVGPYDLSVSLGVPGAAFDHPKMSAALERVVTAARNGRHVFTTVGDRQDCDYSAMLVSRGVQGLIFATDGLVFLQACKRLVGQLMPERSART
jgi:4-hydroxy-2-oxoheptanedioate aldolase